MQKKKVLILGAGISGLTAAYTLKQSSEFDVTVLEATESPGGAVATDLSTGFLLERGPRTFRTAHSPALLGLIESLGLEKELIYSDPAAEKRFLWMQGKLRPVMNRYTLIPALRALVTEWAAASCQEDESIWDFAERRFGKQVALRLLDPLVLGIHAGDLRTLSVEACFPKWKEWERSFGSVTRGFWQHKKKKVQRPPLFSLKGGAGRLIASLATALPHAILYRERVTALRFLEDGIEVTTTQGQHRADLCISALPPHILGGLLASTAPDLAALLYEIPMQKIQVVHLAWSHFSARKGFGYLIPSSEKERALGVVFDSSIFPQQNQTGEECRLTVMLREGGKEEALDVVRRHLRITSAPCVIEEHTQAIPQLVLGHPDRMRTLQEQVALRLPRLQIVGNYLAGLSVNDCISHALKTKGWVSALR